MKGGIPVTRRMVWGSSAVPGCRNQDFRTEAPALLHVGSLEAKSGPNVSSPPISDDLRRLVGLLRGIQLFPTLRLNGRCRIRKRPVAADD
jgi:hypothetical protein